MDTTAETRERAMADASGTIRTRRQRTVAASVDALVGSASRREPMPTPADGLSNAHFEQVTVAGERFVLKHLHLDDDWVARATGDLSCRPVEVWRSGLLDLLPPELDHTIVGCAGGLGRNGWGGAVLMRDVGDRLVATTRSLPFAQHRRFLTHMARMHAAFWGWHDDIGLTPMENRLRFLSPATGEAERLRAGRDAVPKRIATGWREAAEAEHDAVRLALALLDDPSPLLDTLDATPQTLVHGDWKAGNLGCHPDGRTILIDWAFPGRGPACADLAWYLAVNCDLLPESKEDAITAYRHALEAAGVDTRGWWQRQLDTSLVLAFLQLGWSKSGAELRWWTPHVLRVSTALSPEGRTRP